MKWLALLLNVLVVVLGGGIGAMLGTGKSGHLRLRKFIAPIGGLLLMGLGFKGGLDAMFIFSGASKQIESTGMILAVLFLVLGWICGYAFMFDTVFRELVELLLFDVWHVFSPKNNRQSSLIAPKLPDDGFGDPKKQISWGFLLAVIAFAVSPMAIFGATDTGSTILFIKCAVDLVLAIILGIICGYGVIFSAAIVLVVELILMLLSAFGGFIITDTVIHQMAFIGAVIMVIAGVSLSFEKKIKVGHFLPALILPPLLELIATVVYWLTNVKIVK